MIKKIVFAVWLLSAFVYLSGFGVENNPDKKELGQQDSGDKKGQLKIESSTKHIRLTDLNLLWKKNDQQGQEKDAKRDDALDESEQVKTLSAAAGWTTIMTEDFEGDFPGNKWILGYNGNSNQEGYGYTWDDDDYKPHSGSNSGWCADENYKGKPDLDPQNDNYPNYLIALMIYGPFNLSDATDAELLFYYWNESEENCDFLFCAASIDRSHFYGDVLSSSSRGWINQNFDLTNVYTLGNLCGKSQVWIAFWFQSDDGTTYKGAFVDDIILQKYVGTAEQITVTSPNGGEVWDVGTSKNITWTSQNTSGNVKIEYSTNGGSSWSTIVSSTSDDGSYSWTIPNTPSTNCYVRITDVDGTPSDKSDGPFTIKSEGITVTSPNGGEVWQVGTNHNITWTSSGTSGNVKLEYSTNSGASWSIIVASTPDDGSHSWTVPNTPSTNCYVRITDVDGSPSDMSNGPFTIAIGENITVTSPNGGEVWQAGTSQNITWTSSGTSGNVKIEYSTNSGASWSIIIASTPNDGSHSWTIPNTPSPNCYVRITDVDGTPSDMSDGPFTIASGPDWIVPITISGGGNTFIRTFGGDADAIAGLDAFDVAAAPPGMTYYAYFEISVFPNYLDTDVRGWVSPYKTDIDWTLRIDKTQGITSTLSWNMANIPSGPDIGTFTLVGSGLNINMRNQGSAQVSGDATLIIQYRSGITVTYNFSQQGWYLISLPLTPANNSLSALFPTAMAAFAYDPGSGSYTSVTALVPKKGYWLLIPSSTSSTITGVPLTAYTEHYNMGWHLIGTVAGTTNFTDPNDNPNGSVIATYGWNPGTSQYYPVYPPGTGMLNEKEGYWLAVSKSCDLTIGGTALSKDAVASEVDMEAFYQRFGTQPPVPPMVADRGLASVLSTETVSSRTYPNPFNLETVIEYWLPRAGFTKVLMYNSMGQRIRTLTEAQQSQGIHQVVWDGRNDNGEIVTNGIYFYRIMTQEFVETQKVLLLK